jgi:hypothetical protein
VGLAHRGAWPGPANGFGPLAPFGPRRKQGRALGSWHTTAAPAKILASRRPCGVGRLIRARRCGIELNLAVERNGGSPDGAFPWWRSSAGYGWWLGAREGVAGRVGRVGEELGARVRNATSMVCPEDGRGRLTPAVLDVDGSGRRPSLRWHLELWLEGGLAQGVRRRTSNAVAGGMGEEQRRLLIDAVERRAERQQRSKGSRGARWLLRSSEWRTDVLLRLARHGKGIRATG